MEEAHSTAHQEIKMPACIIRKEILQGYSFFQLLKNKSTNKLHKQKLQFANEPENRKQQGIQLFRIKKATARAKTEFDAENSYT